MRIFWENWIRIRSFRKKIIPLFDRKYYWLTAIFVMYIVHDRSAYPAKKVPPTHNKHSSLHLF